MNSSSKPLDTTRFIAKHVAGLRRSGIRDFFELVAKTDGVISLGIGEPDFDTPEPIRDAVKTAMDTGKTHYTSISASLTSARRSAATSKAASAFPTAGKTRFCHGRRVRSAGPRHARPAQSG